MDQVVYQTLDRRTRVTLRNFWYTVETLSGGRFRRQGSTRSLEGAIASAHVL